MTMAKRILQSPRRRGIAIMLVLMVFGVASTVFLDVDGRDLRWTGTFYSAGGQNSGWIHARERPWDWIYRYGEIPTIAMATCAVLLLAASYFGKAPAKYRKPCLVVILTVIIGPGMVVTGILKNSWGRPRPVEITAFGGDSEYRKIWPPAGTVKGKSFTCGHCAMAFSISSASAFFPYHPWGSAAALIVGVTYGSLAGIARATQGGHFVTDAIWSGVIVLIIIAGLYYLVFRIPEEALRSPDARQK
ncbi:MAG: phosphatase PAP2 family protein [Desulfomonile sp.]